MLEKFFTLMKLWSGNQSHYMLLLLNTVSAWWFNDERLWGSELQCLHSGKWLCVVSPCEQKIGTEGEFPATALLAHFFSILPTRSEKTRLGLCQKLLCVLVKLIKGCRCTAASEFSLIALITQENNTLCKLVHTRCDIITRAGWTAFCWSAAFNESFQCWKYVFCIWELMYWIVLSETWFQLL